MSHDNKGRNEADTRADLIDPVLKQAATTEEFSVVQTKGMPFRPSESQKVTV